MGMPSDASNRCRRDRIRRGCRPGILLGANAEPLARQSNSRSQRRHLRKNVDAAIDRPNEAAVGRHFLAPPDDVRGNHATASAHRTPVDLTERDRHLRVVRQLAWRCNSRQNRCDLVQLVRVSFTGDAEEVGKAENRCEWHAEFTTEALQLPFGCFAATRIQRSSRRRPTASSCCGWPAGRRRPRRGT